jgi:hypothetical protein
MEAHNGQVRSVRQGGKEVFLEANSNVTETRPPGEMLHKSVKNSTAKRRRLLCSRFREIKLPSSKMIPAQI